MPTAPRLLKTVALAMVALWAVVLCGTVAAQSAPAQSGKPTAAAEQPWKLLEEHWYALKLGGKGCGYNSERVEQRDGLVRTVSESELRLGRMGQQVTVRTRTEFTETAAGKPLEAVVDKATGAKPTRIRVLFNDDTMDVIEEQGSRAASVRKPIPRSPWLTPNQAREFMRKRVTGGADTMEYATLDAETGMELVRMQSTRTGSGTMQLGGKTITTSVWSTKNSLISKPSIEEISSDGVLVNSKTDLGVGILEAALTTKDLAKSQKGSAEVMARTFVPLPQDGTRLIRANTAQLKVTTGARTLADLPSAGAQKATRLAPSETIIDIDLKNAQPIERGEDADSRYTRASVMVDSEEPHIAALARAALQGVSDDPYARVDALRAAVSKHLKTKNLASGFATATEACTSRSGDCSEHAVLLAAVLRNSGIPARVASGLLFVEEFEGQRNVFGWHMWTQALVNGTWIDADAVLTPNAPRTHAGHLLIATSAADSASLDGDMARILDFVGEMQIELISIDGVPVAKPKATGAGKAK